MLGLDEMEWVGGEALRMFSLESPSLAVLGPEISKLGLSLLPSSLPVNASLDGRRSLDHKHTVSRQLAEASCVWRVLGLQEWQGGVGALENGSQGPKH